ncbi:arylsulfatase I isoform X2 [Rhipicephalus sanguineus]|uniref:arylsulfatase I isoform X2 n=1 Tax=Rhipicephalus sanguineus TaxID=34632 RepID=UPI001893698A|nr:arylsulfatase I isoform X2 [Rhipicephalus sanguineus]
MQTSGDLLWRLVLLHFVSGQTKSRPPHIILVVADDMGWNDISWNNEKMHTPNLQALAQEGVILDQHYVLPTCTPTRAALLTGRYPYKLGIQGHGIRPLEPYGLPLGMTTLAEELKRRDYTTHAFGKWHLGYCDWTLTPTRRGFDSFRGYYLGSQDYFTHMTSGGRTSPEIEGYDYRNYESVDESARGIYSTTLITQNVLDTIEEKSKKNGPVFLYVAFQAVHAPLQVPDDYRTKCSSYTKKRLKICEMAAAMDDSVGLIVEKLKKVEMWNNSLFVFMSDNGGQVLYGGSNWPLRGNKNTLYEGGTRVPAIVAGPVLQSTGYTSSSVMHAVDWFPTLLSATGVKSTWADIDGVDHWPIIRDGTGDAPRSGFIYNLDRREKKLVGAIRDGDLKLIMRPSKTFGKWYAESEEETESAESVDNSQISVLYNITADPYEKDDLFTKLRSEARRLSNTLRDQAHLMVPSPSLEDEAEGYPSKLDPAGAYGPGWCKAPTWKQSEPEEPVLNDEEYMADYY